MAGKFFDLNEAASALGVTPDQLMEMRQRGDIHGYRDGTSWKFKAEEIERVKSEQGGSGGDEYTTDFEHLIPPSSPDDEPGSSEDSVSILVSEETLGKSSAASSKVIGESGVLKDESSILGSSKSSSHLNLDRDAGSSDLKLASDSGVLSGKEMQLDKSSGGTGELSLSDESKPIADSGSMHIHGSALSLDSSEELSLSEDSEELVLGGSGMAGSDVSLDPRGSGINLAKPTESGLSLEEPLELGGSHMESLELPEDDEVMSISPSADPDSATMLKADEEFSLGPHTEGGGDDSSDSGSQVIDLEDSEGFADSAATMLGPGEAQFVPTDGGGMDASAGFAAAPMGGLGPSMMAPTPAMQMPAAPLEAPYSLWNVLSLLCVFMVMSLTGVLMVDVLRNMWAFDNPYSVSSSVMDSIIEVLKM